MSLLRGLGEAQTKTDEAIRNHNKEIVSPRRHGDASVAEFILTVRLSLTVSKGSLATTFTPCSSENSLRLKSAI